jgi:hypothetical protein
MTTRLVDVFDGAGAKLFTCSVALEDANCLDAEFEEVALIIAVNSGLVAAKEIAQLQARCDASATQDAPEQISQRPRPRRPKNTVVSLVKHRMKRAGIGGISQNRRGAL